MTVLIIILILFVLFFVFESYFTDYVRNKYNTTYQKLREMLFLFRYFLIGKYFCEMPKGLKQKKRLWYWMNKLLWITITFTSAYGIKCLMELI